MTAVEDLRRRLQKTQKEFAQLLGVDTGTVSRNENKDVPSPEYSAACLEIARHHGLQALADDLVELYKKKTPPERWGVVEERYVPTAKLGLHSRPTEVQYSHRHQPWIDKLVEILESWDKRLHNSIKSSLDSFVLLARVPRDIIESVNLTDPSKEPPPAGGGSRVSPVGHHPQDDRLVRRKKKAAS